MVAVHVYGPLRNDFTLHGDGRTQTGKILTSSFAAYFIYRGQTYPIDAKLSLRHR